MKTLSQQLQRQPAPQETKSTFQQQFPAWIHLIFLPWRSAAPQSLLRLQSPVTRPHGLVPLSGCAPLAAPQQPGVLGSLEHLPV